MSGPLSSDVTLSSEVRILLKLIPGSSELDLGRDGPKDNGLGKDEPALGPKSDLDLGWIDSWDVGGVAGRSGRVVDSDRGVWAWRAKDGLGRDGGGGVSLR